MGFIWVNTLSTSRRNLNDLRKLGIWSTTCKEPCWLASDGKKQYMQLGKKGMTFIFVGWLPIEGLLIRTELKMLYVKCRYQRLLHFSPHQQVMCIQLDYNVASKWMSESTSYQYKIKVW